ncbi:hypothetical protein [Dehalobacter sp. TeCB1]|jgi:hypothetical protein|uniref:hypothetical protein n=1 Tax=Dehalobacter sp. TeCB1 TaxID=1843715 RepID=UPI00083B9A33|nr:hypothetical protein [Dehalobacter sp. TeCB1]OCZ52191.1 hypothetical protein A7D23_11295 [Dehalobacter sp. TeCB1]
MSKIIDLSVLVHEPLIFRDTTGEEYVIPGEVDLGFVIKLTAYQEQVAKIKNETEAIKKAQELIVDILNLDQSKKITLDFVKERFNDIRYIKLIIESMMSFINEIVNDPNSDSPA